MKPMLRIFGYVRRHIPAVTLNIVFNLLHVLFNLGSYVMIIPFVELMFGHSSLPEAEPALGFSQGEITTWAFWHLAQYRTQWGVWRCLLAVGGAYVGCSLLSNLFSYLALSIMAGIRTGVSEQIRNDLYHKVTILPVSYFNHQRHGDLISRMANDIPDMEQAVDSAIQSLIKDPLKIVIFGFTLCFISWRLFVLFLVVLPVGVWLIARIGRSLKRNSQRGQDLLGALFARLEEGLASLRSIKAFGREHTAEQDFAKANSTYARTMVRVAKRLELSGPLSEVLGTLGLVFILIAGGWQVIDGHILPSVFIFFVIVFARIIPPIQACIKAYNNLMKGAASARRFYQVMEADELIMEKPQAPDAPRFSQCISYRDVSFAFPDGKQALSHINLDIPYGSTVAIVGPSGAGKSTLVDLLSRFYDVGSGLITLDGTPIADLNINSLRRQFGLVSQQCILFNDTVARNISFGSDGYTDEQIRQAARMAQADDFISALPQGYDTPVGDRGLTLSGGQRQRISIARAMLKNPPVLILDEATSALDSESEQAVQQSIEALMKGRTSIVIAHRLSTIRHADRIVVLDQGSIVQQGTHEELMARDGLYQNLVNMQSFRD